MPARAAVKYPPIFALGGIVAGIMLASHIAIPVWLPLLLALISLFGVAVLYHKQYLPAAGIIGISCLLFLSAFNFSFRYRTFPFGHIAHLVDDGTAYQIFGKVDDWPELKYQKTELVIAVDSVKGEGGMQRAQGRLLLTIGTETTRLQYGDRIYFESRIYSLKGGKNFSGYNRIRHLNLQGVFGAAYLAHQYSLQIDPVGPTDYNRLIGELRADIKTVFQNTLDTSSAALASGFLIGETRDIRPEIYRSFRDSGTLHLLAVSGSNVALVILIFAMILKGAPFRKGIQILILLSIIIIFSSLAYNQPSVVRAALMASLLLIGKFLQRRVDYNNIIAAAALIILIFRPGDLFDIGFQLSFAVAWGLIILLPIISQIFEKWGHHRILKFIFWPIAVSVIAQLISMPLTAYYFHRFPLISFAANLIIVPLVSVATIGEIVLLLSASLLPILGNLLGSWLDPLFQSIIYLLKLLTSSEAIIQPNWPIFGGTLFLYYALIFFGAAGIRSRTARRLCVMAVLIGLNWIVFSHLLAPKENPAMTIVPHGGGVIVINHSRPPQIILSDLPESDYDIIGTSIMPLLKRSQFQEIEVIALSSDCPTLSAACSLMISEIRTKVYIANKANNLFADLMAARGKGVDSKVILYSGRNSGDSILANSINIRGNWAICRWEQSKVLIANKSFAPIEVPPEGIDILILPDISPKKIEGISGWPKPLPQCIIANRVRKDAVGEISKIYKKAGQYRPKMVPLSQVGVVELVNKDSHLSLSE
jgi:competence protein ComEC